MKKSHLTLRIPAAMSGAIDRLSRLRGVPKSEVVREAVASYVAGRPDSAQTARTVSAAELARRWATIPHLNPEEAKAMGNDIAAGRSALPRLSASWE